MGQTIPGGQYADADGKGYHDAWGNKIDALGGKQLEKAIEEQAKLSPEELAAQSRQQQAQLAAEDAEKAASKAAADAKAAAREASIRGSKRK